MVSLGGRLSERRARGFESRHERLKSSFEAFFFKFERVYKDTINKYTYRYKERDAIHNMLL